MRMTRRRADADKGRMARTADRRVTAAGLWAAGGFLLLSLGSAALPTQVRMGELRCRSTWRWRAPPRRPSGRRCRSSPRRCSRDGRRAGAAGRGAGTAGWGCAGGQRRIRRTRAVAGHGRGRVVRRGRRSAGPGGVPAPAPGAGQPPPLGAGRVRRRAGRRRGRGDAGHVRGRRLRSGAGGLDVAQADARLAQPAGVRLPGRRRYAAAPLSHRGGSRISGGVRMRVMVAGLALGARWSPWRTWCGSTPSAGWGPRSNWPVRWAWWPTSPAHGACAGAGRAISRGAPSRSAAWVPAWPGSRSRSPLPRPRVAPGCDARCLVIPRGGCAPRRGVDRESLVGAWTHLLPAIAAGHPGGTHGSAASWGSRRFPGSSR